MLSPSSQLGRSIITVNFSKGKKYIRGLQSIFDFSHIATIRYSEFRSHKRKILTSTLPFCQSDSSLDAVSKLNSSLESVRDLKCDA